jgi:hypothetical protein
LKGVRGAEVIDKLNQLSKPFKTEIHSEASRYLLSF